MDRNECLSVNYLGIAGFVKINKQFDQMLK